MKSPANAKGNAQHRCMFESSVKQNQSPVLVLTKERDLSCSVNAVSTGNRKFSLPPLI